METSVLLPIQNAVELFATSTDANTPLTCLAMFGGSYKPIEIRLPIISDSSLVTYFVIILTIIFLPASLSFSTFPSEKPFIFSKSFFILRSNSCSIRLLANGSTDTEVKCFLKRSITYTVTTPWALNLAISDALIPSRISEHIINFRKAASYHEPGWIR